MSRGISEERAKELIIMGFIERFREELPMEYAVELNALLKNYFWYVFSKTVYKKILHLKIYL